MQVAKWGNSLAVRLPALVVNALGLKEGDEIEIDVADVRHFQVKKSTLDAAVLQRLGRYQGQLPVDFKFDRLLANSR